MLDSIKKAIGDWWKSATAKRLQATLITVVITTVADQTGWISTDQANRLAGVVIALIIGDSLRPLNPDKVKEE
tara:strand:+ start:345 stop:563 length:219 start_codon:yes stop_codon:yes gene_type:complete